MPRRASTPKPRKTSRRWHIPLPLLHGAETLEGGGVLNELPGETGLVLWQALRDVMLWAQTPERERPALFAPGAPRWHAAAGRVAREEEALREPLAALAALFQEPGEAAAERAARACGQIAEWAEVKGNLATALAFAQDAALVYPTDPHAAFAAGRIARMSADHARAEVWFRRSIGLARQARNWRLYSQAFLGLGRLAKERGNYPAARYLWTRALRGARRGGLRTEKGNALHDLWTVAIETGRTQEATRLARAALEAYGAGHPRLPGLAHDVAYGWMEQGCFDRSLPVFRALLPHLQQPLEQLFAWANIARAAAGSGDRTVYEQAYREVEQRLADPRVGQGEARALLEVARGAAYLGEWDRARDMAGRALAVAQERGEGQPRFAAEALLDQVSRRERLKSAAAEPGAPQTAEADERLALEMIRSLEPAGAA